MGVEVEGFYIKSVGPVSNEFLPIVPLRVLFGRSGAGKSTILDGLTRACSGLDSLSRQRRPVGTSGLILKVSEDEIPDYELSDQAYSTRVDEARVAVNQQLSDLGLDPVADGLHDWIAAAFIGDDRMDDLATYQYLPEIDSAIKHYSPISVLEQIPVVCAEYLGKEHPFQLIDPADAEHVRPVLNAFLKAPHVLYDSNGEMSVVLDGESLDQEVVSALEELAASYERTDLEQRFDHKSINEYGSSVSGLASYAYFAARSYCNGLKRWVAGPIGPVNTRARGEFFDEAWRPMIRVVNLGGNVEQSVEDFETSLTDAMPALHDQLMGNLLVKNSPPPSRATEEDRAVIDSGMLAPMRPPQPRRIGRGMAITAEDDRDRWMQAIPTESLATGGVHVRQTIWACCRYLTDRANELLPDFLRQHGEILVYSRPIQEWTAGRRPRIGLALVQEGSWTSLESVASGIRRWLLAVVDWAYQELRVSELGLPEAYVENYGVLTGGIPLRAELVSRLSEFEVVIPEQTGILIIDEPELHLDPRTQLQVAEWLKTISREGTSIVLASHSPAFLTYQSQEAMLTGVVRAGASTETVDMSSSLLDWCEDFGGLVGLTNADKIWLSAGFIVVEGPHDSKVLHHFFGPELDTARIQLLHLYGTHGEQSLIDSEFLVGFGKPLGILLDKIRREKGQIMRWLDKHLTNEEKSLKRMWMGLEARGVHPVGAGHPYPDVMCALPEDAVDRAFPDADFPGWEELEKSYRTVPPENFKTFALREMNLEVGATVFIDRVLKHCPEDARPRPGLQRAVSELLAALTA